MTTTIAISSQKRGVAKTTTCLSLGTCLAEMGQNVLLIDLDPQANLTLSMGLTPRELRRTAGDALLGDVSLVSVSRESATFGLDIVPANQKLVILDKIDCPPAFGTLSGWIPGCAKARPLASPSRFTHQKTGALDSTVPWLKN